MNSVSFNPSMKQIASGGDDNVVMVWNFKPAMRAFRFVGHRSAVNQVSFSPSGSLIASASSDSTVRLWEPTVRGSSVVLKSHMAAVRTVSWSADNERLATGSDDKSIKVWSVTDHKFLQSFSGHSHWLRSVEMSPACTGSTIIASCSEDKSIRLWDTRSGKQIHSWHETNAFVQLKLSLTIALMFSFVCPVGSTPLQVAFHPSGTCLASCANDGSVKLWFVPLFFFLTISRRFYAGICDPSSCSNSIRHTKETASPWHSIQQLVVLTKSLDSEEISCSPLVRIALPKFGISRRADSSSLCMRINPRTVAIQVFQFLEMQFVVAHSAQFSFLLQLQISSSRRSQLHHCLHHRLPRPTLPLVVMMVVYLSGNPILIVHCVSSSIQCSHSLISSSVCFFFL